MFRRADTWCDFTWRYSRATPEPPSSRRRPPSPRLTPYTVTSSEGLVRSQRRFRRTLAAEASGGGPADTHEAVAQLVAHGVGLGAGRERQRGLRARRHLEQRLRGARQPRLQRRLLLRRARRARCSHGALSLRVLSNVAVSTRFVHQETNVFSDALPESPYDSLFYSYVDFSHTSSHLFFHIRHQNHVATYCCKHICVPFPYIYSVKP